MFGILVCDIRVLQEEDDGHLRYYFQDFAPIIKHATINYEDIGEFMQGVRDRSGIKVKDRRCVIDSYFGKGIGIIDKYLVWLLEKGLVIECIHSYDTTKSRYSEILQTPLPRCASKSIKTSTVRCRHSWQN